ncbi:hypothetical protein B0H66DRAFT_538999 [Apodospora peruviana]|uniref:Uncharacterized protein n=1 Tax=Apodospora peruviana TaxID=516989 RepID=A0AAE0LY39_9PEZI|nr:hypothetical protein B0H66DRAFT_538999 [Apodospora peruviana]
MAQPERDPHPDDAPQRHSTHQVHVLIAWFECTWNVCPHHLAEKAKEDCFPIWTHTKPAVYHFKEESNWRRRMELDGRERGTNNTIIYLEPIQGRPKACRKWIRNSRRNPAGKLSLERLCVPQDGKIEMWHTHRDMQRSRQVEIETLVYDYALRRRPRVTRAERKLKKRLWAELPTEELQDEARQQHEARQAKKTKKNVRWSEDLRNTFRFREQLQRRGDTRGNPQGGK